MTVVGHSHRVSQKELGVLFVVHGDRWSQKCERKKTEEFIYSALLNLISRRQRRKSLKIIVDVVPHHFISLSGWVKLCVEYEIDFSLPKFSSYALLNNREAQCGKQLWGGIIEGSLPYNINHLEVTMGVI